MIEEKNLVITIQDEYFSVKQCNENPMNLYIFGDNSLHYGKKGQAIIRDCDNSIGIPTKRKPSMSYDAFMRDEKEDYESVAKALKELKERSKHYNNIIFPRNGIGTGLAMMDKTSPKLFKKLYEVLNINLKDISV